MRVERGEEIGGQNRHGRHRSSEFPTNVSHGEHGGHRATHYSPKAIAYAHWRASRCERIAGGSCLERGGAQFTKTRRVRPIRRAISQDPVRIEIARPTNAA